jgi:hypothetical protein
VNSFLESKYSVIEIPEELEVESPLKPSPLKHSNVKASPLELLTKN